MKIWKIILIAYLIDTVIFSSVWLFFDGFSPWSIGLNLDGKGLLTVAFLVFTFNIIFTIKLVHNLLWKKLVYSIVLSSAVWLLGVITSVYISHLFGGGPYSF